MIGENDTRSSSVNCIPTREIVYIPALPFKDSSPYAIRTRRSDGRPATVESDPMAYLPSNAILMSVFRNQRSSITPSMKYFLMFHAWAFIPSRTFFRRVISRNASKAFPADESTGESGLDRQRV